ncbi:MAG: hypothetical protein ACI4VN_01040 [Clostridia bacterium]|nr:hypothetical protein [Clostridia bacterium]
MPIISFWSDKKKETAQTLSMIALASYMSVENNSRILIVDTNVNDKTIKTAYFNQQESATRKAVMKLNAGKIDIGSGIEGLAKLLASGKNSGEAISDYSQVIFKGRLEVILSLETDRPGDIERIKTAYKDLIKLANQQYDYVFVDLQKGFGDPFIEEILKMSYVVVYNITQRQIDLDDYKKTKENHPMFKENKVLPLIGRYDRYSKFTKKNVARALGEKKEIPAVSYNTLFFENANEGAIGGFFLKFRKSLMSSNDRNIVFVDEVANAVDRLILKTQEVLMTRRD